MLDLFRFVMLDMVQNTILKHWVSHDGIAFGFLPFSHILMCVINVVLNVVNVVANVVVRVAGNVSVNVVVMVVGNIVVNVVVGCSVVVVVNAVVVVVPPVG